MEDRTPLLAVKSLTGLVFDDKSLSYKAVVKSNPKDRIEVVVGDDKDPSKFQPQVKIQRWDNEVNSSIRLVLPEAQETVFQDAQEHVVIERKELDVRMYERDDMEEGGFEFEIVLKEVPKSNIFEFTVNTKELDWLYQPSMKEEVGMEGVVVASDTDGFGENGEVVSHRPEFMVGGFEVLHKTKGHLNESSGMDYRAGKAFEVHSPMAKDRAGAIVKCLFNRDVNDSGKLTVTIPWEFLKEAEYPVIIDPTIGYTSAYGSSSSFNLDTALGVVTTAVENGTVTSVSSYAISAPSPPYNLKGLILNGSDLSLTTNGISNEGQITTEPGWGTYSYTTSPSIVNGAGYLITVVYGQTTSQAYALSSGVKSRFEADNNYASPQSMSGVITDSSRLRSIYATYTASGGGGAAPATGFMTTNTGFWGT